MALIHHLNNHYHNLLDEFKVDHLAFHIDVGDDAVVLLADLVAVTIRSCEA